MPVAIIREGYIKREQHRVDREQDQEAQPNGHPAEGIGLWDQKDQGDHHGDHPHHDRQLIEPLAVGVLDEPDCTDDEHRQEQDAKQSRHQRFLGGPHGFQWRGGDLF